MSGVSIKFKVDELIKGDFLCVISDGFKCLWDMLTRNFKDDFGDVYSAHPPALENFMYHVHYMSNEDVWDCAWRFRNEFFEYFKDGKSSLSTQELEEMIECFCMGNCTVQGWMESNKENV